MKLKSQAKSKMSARPHSFWKLEGSGGEPKVCMLFIIIESSKMLTITALGRICSLPIPPSGGCRHSLVCSHITVLFKASIDIFLSQSILFVYVKSPFAFPCKDTCNCI